MSELPAGFVLDEPQGSSAPASSGLPEGFVLDNAPAQPQEPTAKAQSYTGGILPFSIDAQGNAQFDSNAGILGGIKRAITLPREVYEGTVDLNTQEGGDRVGEAALTIINPAPGKMTTQGTVGIPRAEQKSWLPGGGGAAPSGTLQAADELGISVPRGVASDSRAMQAAFQRLRQVPGATGVVDKSLDDFYSSVFKTADDVAVRAGGGIKQTPDGVGGNIRQALTEETARNEAAAADDIARTQRTADEYRAGVQADAQGQIAAAEKAAQDARNNLDALAPTAADGTKATIGDDLKASLEKRIQFHKDEQGKPYDVLRQRYISADKPVGVTDELAGTLNAIMQERIAAAEGAIPRDLTPVVDIATNPRGVTFNGLQRARSTLAERIDFEQSQGFDAGDLKRAYGALTDAMRTVVKGSARWGGEQAALRQFELAEKNFGSRADLVGDLSSALRNGPESLVDRMVAYAGDRGGANINKLRTLQKELPPEEAAKVSRLAFQRLALDGKGEFSETALVRNWAAISPEGRAALFGANASRIDQAIKSLTGASQAAKFASEIGGASIKAAEKDAKFNIDAATKGANARASAQNRELLSLLSKSDEQIVNTALGWATQGAGADIQKLVRMSTVFGEQNMNGLASVAIQKLGTGRNNEFSAAAFASNWKELSNSGKALLFRDKEVRASLDNLATITERMANAQKKFGNSSGTGGAVLGGSLVTWAIHEPFSALAAVVGANAAARLLAKPAVAKAASNYAKVWQRYAFRPSPAAQAALEKSRAQLLMTATKGYAISGGADDGSQQPLTFTVKPGVIGR